MKLLPSAVGRFLGDDKGQDLVEYALLGLFVGIVGVATWDAIVTGLGTSYLGYDSGIQALWEPKDP